jgi:predicted MFS family arabinose efflux permease
LTQGFVLNIVGQVFALLIALGAIGGGVYCISKGYQWSGGFLGGLPILGLVWVFVRTHAKGSDTPDRIPDGLGNPPEPDKK